MAKKNIKINLFNQKSIQSAIKQLEQYRDDLPRKCQEICRRLCEIGQQTALVAIQDSPQGKAVTLRMDIDPSRAGCKAMLIGTGKTVTDDKGRTFNLLLGIEFGSGIRLNPTANPLASEFGMGVGTFPDQKHALNPGGWMYLDKDGNWKHSYGIKATMPFYKAMNSMRQNLDKVVKEVFG